MPKKVPKDKTAQRFWTALAGPEGVKPQVLQMPPGSLEIPKQIQCFKALAKLACCYRQQAQTVASLKP